MSVLMTLSHTSVMRRHLVGVYESYQSVALQGEYVQVACTKVILCHESIGDLCQIPRQVFSCITQDLKIHQMCSANRLAAVMMQGHLLSYFSVFWVL